MAYYKVSGYVKNSGASPIPGVQMYLQSPTGVITQAETNYLGYYEFPSVEAKATAYNLWASRAGVSFTPSIRTFIVDGNKTKDYTAASNPAGRHYLSGTVTGATGTSFRIKRRLAGGDVYVWTYSDPDTGAWKIWYAVGTAGSYEVSAEDPTGVYTMSAAQTVTYSTSDISGINFTASTTATTSYALTGYVTNAVGGAAAAGIAVSIIGTTYPEEITCITDSTGKYSMMAKPDIYTITPSRSGATFTPTSRTATVVNTAVAGGDFTVTYANTGSISGTLTHSDGSFGTIVSFHVTAENESTGVTYLAEILSPTTYPVTYVINGVAAGTYTIYPDTLPETGSWSADKTGVVVTTVDVPSQDFLWTKTAAGTGSIAGTVTLNGANFAGVNLELRSGSSVTGTLLQETDSASDGTYSFASLANGTYTVVPVKSGYTFAPVSITITTTGVASTANNFTATLGGGTGSTYTISGLCYQGTSTGVPGVLVTAGSYSATTDAFGVYAITGVPVGTYTIRASKINYTWTAHGFTNPVTVGYGNVEDIDWLGTGGTGGGGGGSDVAVPYVFTNAHDDYAESVDADKLNANFDTLADAVNNISDANIAESAGIDPAKVGSSLGKANLEADILDMDARIEEVLEVDPDFIKYAMLPCDEDGIEISGGADGSVTVGAGKHLLLMGKRIELTATTLPTEGTLAAQSVYALRARLATADDVEDDSTLTEGDLIIYTVPLAGNALGSGDTGSTKYTVAQVTGGTSGSKFTISGQGSAPLLGAYMVSLDSSYEKAFISYNSGGTVMLADALGVTPTTDSRIGICIDDPDYEDDPGTLGGVSTPDNALLAIIYCGSTGQTPYVQKMIPRNYETLGRGRTISSSWSERTVLADSDEPGYDEVQLTLPSAITAPVQVVTIMAVLYDTESTAPTDGTGMFFGPMASIAFKVPDLNPKGLEMRVTPEKLIARFAKGKLRILSNAADEGVAVKSACFKAVVTI